MKKQKRDNLEFQRILWKDVNLRVIDLVELMRKNTRKLKAEWDKKTT